MQKQEILEVILGIRYSGGGCQLNTAGVALGMRSPMSLCINPNCPNPENLDNRLFCEGCDSELLLEARYRVRCLLGSGGFGKTYEVSDRNGTSKVLKVLINNEPKYVELFQREAQVLSSLNHPSIPKMELEYVLN